MIAQFHALSAQQNQQLLSVEFSWGISGTETLSRRGHLDSNKSVIHFSKTAIAILGTPTAFWDPELRGIY